MKESTSAAIGFLAASVVPPVVLSLTFPLSGQLTLESLIGSFVVSYGFSALFIVLFGVPSFFLFRRFAPGHWWSVTPVGFILGMLTSIAVQPNSVSLKPTVIYGLIGAATVLVFWLVWRRAWKGS
jgi:hypothetical protein